MGFNNANVCANELLKAGVAVHVGSGEGISARPVYFKDVLVCTDFSPVSNLAVKEAVRLCQKTRAHLLLLHVFEYGPASSRKRDSQDFGIELREKESEHLSDVLTEIRGSGVPAEAILRDGVASEMILHLIAERNVDLAIVGTHGLRGIERMVFGSTAETVFRKGLCPVMTVGPRVMALGESGELGPVIFATDFQRPTATAVRYAAELANLAEAPLHCVNVLPLPMESESESGIVSRIMMEALHHLVDSERICVKKPICSITYDSEVSSGIVDYAKAQHAKLIVLGVRQKSLLSAHLPPQVTYRTIVTAPCPVLTVSFNHA
jgi:nucleotide-binding universal stress UspA family protein